MYNSHSNYHKTVVLILSVWRQPSQNIGHHKSQYATYAHKAGTQPLAVMNVKVDMTWCLYKVYKNPMNWADARQICSEEGHDLLRISDSAEHSYLTSYFMSSLGSASPSLLESTLWIGMQQLDGDVPRWHDDCTSQANTYSPASAAPSSACFVFDNEATTLTHDACSASKMFICKAKSYDLTTCYTTVSAMKDVAFTDASYGGITAPTDCARKCSERNCVGYTHDLTNDVCRLATFQLSAVFSKGAELKYMKDLISTEAKTVTFPHDVTSEPCFSSVPSVVPVATTTALPEVTTTAVPVVSTTAISSSSSSSTASSVSSVLETSMMTTTAETSSSPTPQLSNTITTVDLTSNAQSTESVTNLYTGTSSSSCYHCFCNSNLMTSLSPEELQSQIENLKKELTVEKKDLSSWKRKLISIPDERVSAKSLGYLGAGMLAVVFGAVVLIDLPRFMNGLKVFYHSVCSHKKINTIE
ncbi:mucin-5AC-like [Ylistrum balloti]|uniref:mucin-5AC-like n=1 Tax=Ylistrum balloti TaxID=509963 RepID=UPI002905BBC7|nr:mucin-5AC-like [Ylistrum balloti]